MVDILRALREVGQARALLKRGANVLQLISKDQPKGVSAASMVAYLARWVEFERREGDLDTYKVALAKYTALAHLAPPTNSTTAGGSKARDKRGNNCDAEDPAKAARREAVMKKWEERKALEAGTAPQKGKGKRSRTEGDETEAATKKSKTSEVIRTHARTRARTHTHTRSYIHTFTHTHTHTHTGKAFSWGPRRECGRRLQSLRREPGARGNGRLIIFFFILKRKCTNPMYLIGFIFILEKCTNPVNIIFLKLKGDGRGAQRALCLLRHPGCLSSR